MRHFIGGWALGFLLILVFGNNDRETVSDFWVVLTSSVIAGTLSGFAAWGLLP